jgi:predicted dehydrogenase
MRWGILSTAQHARNRLVPAIQAAEGHELLAIASRDSGRAAAAASDLGIARSYEGYDELLADPDIDAVYNPLPNHLHLPMTVAAMEAGKHVLCEKPVGLDRNEVVELGAAMERTGRRAMEAFMYKHHPQWDLVMRLIGEGRIGDVRMTQAWFSYDQRDDTNIRWVPDYGGGALYDIGCYTINSARLVFGEEPQDVAAVMKLHPEHGVDAVTSAALEFSAGHATFTVSVEQAPSQAMNIVGTEGHIHIDRPFNPWIGRDALVRVHHEADVEEYVVPEADHFRLEVERFGEAIANDTPFVVTLDDSLANMAVIDAIFAAVR